MKRFFPTLSEAEPLGRGGALDALRFLAAAFIVLYHYENHAPLVFADIHPALGRSYLATDFFLMLSGYVLGRTYGPRVEAGKVAPGRFLLLRVARVWPAHVIVLAGFAALVLAAGAAGLTLNNPHAFQWSALPGHAALMQAWGLGVPYGWNTPTWSLSALIICYAAFPAIWSVLSRLPRAAALAASLGAVLAVHVAAWVVGLNFFDLAGEVGVLRALPLFALGAALARFGAPEGVSTAGVRVIGLGAAAVFFGSQLLGHYDVAAILSLAALIWAAGARTPRKPSSLVRRAAELSFALYITHSLAGMVFYRALGLALPEFGGPAAWVVWLTGFPFAVTFALLFHRLIDTPVQAWLKPRLKRPVAAPTVSVPAV